MSETADEHETTEIRVSVSTDSDGFLRRACPLCGREFKTEIQESDLASVLAPAFARMSDDIGTIGLATAQDDAETLIGCPFCGHRAEASEFLTDELVSYIRAIALREIMFPKINKMFGGLADTFGGPRPRDSLLSIQLEHQRGVQPVRPLHGPEPRDMKIVRVLCCGRRFKVPDRWYDVSACPYCEAAIRLVG